MRIHAARVSHIAETMIRRLKSDGDIECESDREAILDVEAVLNQYIQDEQAITDKARDLLASRGLPGSELGKMRRLVADQRQIKIGDEAIDYLLNQLVEMLLYSNNIDEVFADDLTLRRKLREPLRAEAAVEQDLQQAVRGQLKHVQEGTSMWEVEYHRMMEDIRRRKGL